MKDYLDELAEQAYCYFQKDYDRHVPNKHLFTQSVEKVLPPNGNNHHDSTSMQVMMMKEVGRRLSALISANRVIKTAHPLARFDRNTRNFLQRSTPVIRSNAELVAETLRIMHVENADTQVAAEIVLGNRQKPELFERVKGDTASFLASRKSEQLRLLLETA